ncbi:hypothetical protein Trco_008038 [Trichoderma cornu-damae]|uniref:PX domain-containing protein n=1 Tax=Trichoderma cornu-damae TaxID=654480 RepID=A0A9P8TSN0_9HYPO|nr:hypothetical protein Trco_008038 [Trichoderma cornu-damae]
MSAQAPAQGAGTANSYAGQPVTSPAGPPAAATAATGATAGAMSNQNLNQIVTDYLLKRGFNRTEEVFRQESKHLGNDGKPVQQLANLGPKKYSRAFRLLREWVENNLEIYKFELSKLLWPIFVYSFIELVGNGYTEEGKLFLKDVGQHFQASHADDLRNFSTITLPQHVAENPITKLYKENKYRVPLNQHATGDLFNFLERESDQGGLVIRQLLVSYCQIDSTARGPITPFSFEAVFRKSKNLEIEEVDAKEGIPGVNIGLSNRDILDPAAPLSLGPLPMDTDLRDDVRAEIEDEERRNPAPPGGPSLLEEFDHKIKREESADAPSRADLPLPPSRPRDIMLEMQKLRENRDRFKIEGRTGGVGVPVSACMFTFHNTFGRQFSADGQLAAVGTSESYIRVWSLDGKALPSSNSHERGAKFNSRKLIGHFGPVYDISFSDSASGPPQKLFGDEGRQSSAIDGRPKLLLSCAGDGQIRLWSLESWTCLCVYKSHDGPVYRAQWGPHGHYFLTGGYDKAVRVWMQDHASPQRLLVGHDTSISAIAWHPNGMYVFSASDETDKSIRMWSVVTGACVRVFTGHTEHISSLECSPNGKILASADIAGNIFFWDLTKGTRIKRSRGHGKGGIWSLSFSVESNVLASSGQDGTVRLWDVESPADPHKAAQQAGLEAATAGADMAIGGPNGETPRINTGTSGPSASTGTTTGSKKKSKEVMITPDQISAFPTKKTPVTKVKFTRMNLVIAGGCYDPDRQTPPEPPAESEPVASPPATSQASTSSAPRPSRAPRRIVAQPTKLEAVDDPLGPLSAEPVRDAAALDAPPVPPQKEQMVIRTTMAPLQQQQQQQHQHQQQAAARRAADPHLFEDDDDDLEGPRGPRLPPPVDAARPSSVRSSTQPSVSVEEAAKPTFYITVGDPVKIGDMTSSHIVYSVRTKTTSRAYKQPEFEVKRRYRDFLWLYNTLHGNNPGYVVPPPPEKQVVGRFDSNFVESRRAALEKMLNKTAAHPVLQHDADLKLFLESEAFNVDIKHKERREPLPTESKGVLGSLGINVGGGTKFVEQDDWFHDRKVYLDALESQLKGLLKSMEVMVSQRKMMAEAAADFSASLHALSTVELSPALSGPLDALSDLQLTIRDVYDRQAQQDVLTFGIIIDEYIRLIGSIKLAFSQRQKGFYAWHSAESELQKKKSTQDKLLRQGKSQQDRLNQMNAEVQEAERKVHQARLLFEDMGRSMRAELDRFEKEKVEDFKSGVETFLEGAVEAQKELIEKWETFLMQLDAQDDESAFYRPPVYQPKPPGNTVIDRARATIDEDSD